MAEDLRFNNGALLHALVDDLGEFVHLVQGLLVFLLQLPHYFERAMLFAEDAVELLTVNPLNLQEVICTPCTLNMERDLTPGVLALDAGAIFQALLATDYAL